MSIGEGRWRMLRKLALRPGRRGTLAEFREWGRADATHLKQLVAMGMVRPVGTDEYQLTELGEQSEALGFADHTVIELGDKVRGVKNSVMLQPHTRPARKAVRSR